MPYESHILKKIKKAAIPLDFHAYDTLLQKIGDAQIVLLGEATHGTHEFYDMRADITKKLIVEKHFNAIAIEGDWPDAYQVNRYIKQQAFANAYEALRIFDRFPTWMWQNIPMVHLVEWLAHHNRQSTTKVGFYGIDLYSLYRSIDAIITYLDNIDSKRAQEARDAYSCFDQFRQDPQQYGYSVFLKLTDSCKDEVVQELKKLETLQWQLVQEKKASSDDMFYLLQNARVVKNSEDYYRSLFIDETKNWNLRDTHMMKTVEEIIKHYKKQGISKPKIVVWGHNSHIGNASATQMGDQGELNIGQLAKEKFGQDAFSLGFTTYNGTVSAASNWHMPVERKVVRDALPHSYEHLFHTADSSQFLLMLDDKQIVPETLLERAIGVVYSPRTERLSHYFYASLAYQFDAVIHYDTTTALEPLEKPEIWIRGEVPETYPSGL